MAAARSEIAHMKVDRRDMTGGLSNLSDEVPSLTATVSSLQGQVGNSDDRLMQGHGEEDEELSYPESRQQSATGLRRP